MYRVKGADQKEYGPISAEQVQQWIQENRLNRFSLVEKDGEPGWKPLDQFPEFLAQVGETTAAPAAPSAAVPPGDFGLRQAPRETALRLVKAPAVALLVFGWIYVAMALWGLVSALVGDNLAKRDEMLRQMEAMPAGPAKDFIIQWLDFMMTYGAYLNVITLVMGALTAYGAIRMMRLQSKGLAWTAAILSVQPCFNPCCCLPMAFGIWAIVVLCKPEVRDSFK